MFTCRHTREHSISSGDSTSSSGDTTRILKKVCKTQKLWAEKIVGKRFRDGQAQLQVKWRGFDLSIYTWELYKDLGNYVPLIGQYEAETLSRSKNKVILLPSSKEHSQEADDDEIKRTFSGYSRSSSPRTPPMLNESWSDGTWSVDSSLNFSPILSPNSSLISTDSSVSSVPVSFSDDDEASTFSGYSRNSSPRTPPMLNESWSDGTWSMNSSRTFSLTSRNSSPISTDSSISSVPRKKKKVDFSGDDEGEKSDGAWSGLVLDSSQIFWANFSPMSTDSSISSVPRKKKMKLESSDDDEDERNPKTVESTDDVDFYSSDSSNSSTDSSICSEPRKKKMKLESSDDDEDERNPTWDESTVEDVFYGSDSPNFFSLLQAKARLKKKLKIGGGSSDSS